jgi:predicted MPP superfamily phosphohydrolase
MEVDSTLAWIAWRQARHLTLGTAVTLAGWAFAVEPGLLRVEQTELSLPGWDRPPLRVALLSDLHVGSPWNGLDKLEQIIDRTNASQPDLVLVLGDLVIQDVVGGTFVPPEDIGAALVRLSAPFGV